MIYNSSRIEAAEGVAAVAGIGEFLVVVVVDKSNLVLAFQFLFRGSTFW